MDPHNYEHRLVKALERVKKSNISNKNKNQILKFSQDCKLDISTGRNLRYVQNLVRIAIWLGKNFEKANKEDIKSLVGQINGMNYTEWTKQFYKVTIRKFYRWLNDSEEDPEITKWIKTTVKKNNQKLPEDLLTEDEVKRLIDAATNPRDKALVSVLYESGCRIGELLTLKIKNVSFDQYGAKILVNGKTGPRRVRIIATVPYLMEWINNHPCKNDPEYPLWIGFKAKKFVTHAQARAILNSLKKSAGINKRIHPHLFRHSRATHLANHLTEAQMKEYFGWTQSSNMASVYVHLSGRDVDNAILKVHGIENNGDKEESKFTPKNCIRCEYSNAPTNKLCGRCGMVLDEKEAIRLVKEETEKKRAFDAMDWLFEDEEFRAMVRRKMGEF